MSIHLTFNNIRKSDAVTDHVHEMFEELLKITENKHAFHVKLNKVNDNQYHVGINCSYRNKQMISRTEDKNLYKALNKGIDSIKTQVLRKSEKLRSA